MFTNYTIFLYGCVFYHLSIYLSIYLSAKCFHTFDFRDYPVSFCFYFTKVTSLCFDWNYCYDDKCDSATFVNA